MRYPIGSNKNVFAGGYLKVNYVDSMNDNSPNDEQKRRLQIAEERREYWQQYYLKNKERVLQRCRERYKVWYANNREYHSKYKKTYWQENGDELREKRMERYWNLEEIRSKKFTPSLVAYKLNVTLSFD